MPTVADLTGNPGTFFANNIVMVAYNAQQRNLGQVWPMWLADGWRAAPTLDLGWTGKHGMPVCTIMNMGSVVGPTFNAIWCPYESGALRQVQLTNAANLMFTAKMDGCTFGVGSEAPNGDRMVCHVNLGGQGQQQADMLAGATSPLAGDADMHYLGPGAYRFYGSESAYTQATTYGVRDTGTGKWQIWSQVCKFNRTNRTIKILEVRRV